MAEVAAGQFLLDDAEEGKAADFFLLGQESFLEGLELQGARGAELGLLFAVPSKKGGFGNVELSADAGEAPALGTECSELVFGFDGVHGQSGVMGCWNVGSVDGNCDFHGRHCRAPPQTSDVVGGKVFEKEAACATDSESTAWDAGGGRNAEIPERGG